MIEQYGDQFLAPMREAVGDALAVAEENQRRLRYAFEALTGNYPGAKSHMNGNGNGHAVAIGATEIPALSPAAAPPELEYEMDVDQVDPKTASLKGLVEQVLKSAARFHFVGAAETAGAMKATEVLAVMTRWGWRPASERPAAVVSATLATLWKEGKAERVGPGNYLYARAKRRHVRGDDGKPVDINNLTISEAVRLILVGADGAALSPAQIVDIAQEAGWRNRSVHRVATVRSIASRHMRKGVAVRVDAGRYAIARSVESQKAEAAEVAEALAASAGSLLAAH